MKFSIKKEVLLHNLNSVGKALSTKNLIPILSGIKFDLDKDGLYLTSTDNDICIKSFIDNKDLISVEKLGSTVILGKYILEIIRKLDNDIINFELLDNIKILISCGKSKFNLNCMDINDYPNLNIEEKKDPIILQKKDFKNLINKTSFAISSQETRPILTGINFKIKDNILECVSTDSYRLAKKSIVLNKKFDEELNVVIPGKNLMELIKILEENDSEIKMNIFNNKVLFSFDNILFQSRVLSGTFPDVDRLIPEKFNLSINANKSELYNVIDRASLLTSEKDKNIIKLEIVKKVATISSNTPEIGKVEESLDIENNNNEDLVISFSSKFMMDAIKTIESVNVVINFNGDLNPIIVKDSEDDTLLQLILPIKTY